MQAANPVIRKLAGPAVLSAILALFYLMSRALQPAWMHPGTYPYLLATLAGSISVVLVRAAGFILFDILFRKRKGREASQLLRMVFALLGYIALFVVIYKVVLDRSLSNVLATSAVLTVILGLALQDTLGNFFAGISLHVEEPYHMGDALHIGDVVGRVESVTWRTTAVRTLNNSLVVFPNSRIARDPIEIYPLNAQNRRTMRFPASYSHSPETVIGLVSQAVMETPNVSAQRKPIVRIADFADSSIIYEILYWLTDYMRAQEIEAAIRGRIWYLFRRQGIEIPFPIRQVVPYRHHIAPPIDPADYRSLLSSVEILKPLSPEESDKVLRSLERHTYAPGETVLRKGESGDSMFIVSRGRAEVFFADENGRQQQIALLSAGDVLGEMSLFTGELRSADARALDELELLEVRKPIMERVLAENQELARIFSEIIAGRQARLAEFTRRSDPEGKTMRSETILQRIKRFFSLS